MSDLFFEKEVWFFETAVQKYGFNFKRICSADFYRDIFPFGSFEEKLG